MDLMNICRLCLAENLQLFSIFDECEATNVKFSDMVATLLGSDYQVSELNLLSKSICESCKGLCREIIRFLETIVASLEYQQKNFKYHTNKESQYEEIIINEMDAEYEHEPDTEQEENFATLIEINQSEHNVNLLLDEDNSYELIETVSSIMDEEEDNSDDNGDLVTCTKCSKSFTSNTKLNVHMKVHEAKVRLHECKECKRKFTSDLQLSRHEIIHSDLIKQVKNEDSFQCIVCKEVADSKQDLDDHVREHKLKIEKEIIPCIHCNKKFDKFNALVRHLKKHDDNRVRQFSSKLGITTLNNIIEHFRLIYAQFATRLLPLDKS